MYVHMCASMHAYMHTCKYACKYIYMHIYVCMHACKLKGGFFFIFKDPSYLINFASLQFMKRGFFFLKNPILSTLPHYIYVLYKFTNTVFICLSYEGTYYVMDSVYIRPFGIQ